MLRLPGVSARLTGFVKRPRLRLLSSLASLRSPETYSGTPQLWNSVELSVGKAGSLVIGRVAQVARAGRQLNLIPFGLSDSTGKTKFTEMDLVSAQGRFVSHVFGVSLRDPLYRKRFLSESERLTTSLLANSTVVHQLLTASFGYRSFSAEDAWLVIHQSGVVSIGVNGSISQHSVGPYALLMFLRSSWSHFEPVEVNQFAARSENAVDLCESIVDALGDDVKINQFISDLRNHAKNPLPSTLSSPLLTAIELLALSTSSSRSKLPLILADKISSSILTPLGLGLGPTGAAQVLCTIGHWHPDSSPTRLKWSLPASFETMGKNLDEDPAGLMAGSFAPPSVQSHVHSPRSVQIAASILSHAEGGEVATKYIHQSFEKGSLCEEEKLLALSAASQSQLSSTTTTTTATVHPLTDGAIGLQRKDLRDLLALAIDDPSTTEVDDAISFDGDSIFVHIADPTSIIQHNSTMDLIGRRRVETIYLPDGKVTMLPDLLATTSLSLRQGVAVPALTFKVKLDAGGAVSEYSIFPSLLRRVQRVNYDQVQQALDSGSHFDLNADICRTLQHLWSLAQQRRKYRQSLGARLVNIPHVDVFAHASTAGTKDVSISTMQSAQQKSRSLVEEMMVLCGEIAGQFSSTERIPVPYRVQRPPFEVDAWNAPPGMNSDLVSIVQTLREISGFFGADTTSHGAPHSSLAFERYVRCSSPIRRYADMLVHYQLKGYIANGHRGLPFDSVMMDHIVHDVDIKTKQIKFLQRHSERYWKTQYVLRHGLGKVWRAIVIDVPGAVVSDSAATATGRRAIQLFLLDLTVSIFVQPPRLNFDQRHLQPGSIVHVTATKRSPIDVFFEITAVEDETQAVDLFKPVPL